MVLNYYLKSVAAPLVWEISKWSVHHQCQNPQKYPAGNAASLAQFVDLQIVIAGRDLCCQLHLPAVRLRVVGSAMIWRKGSCPSFVLEEVVADAELGRRIDRGKLVVGYCCP